MIYSITIRILTPEQRRRRWRLLLSSLVVGVVFLLSACLFYDGSRSPPFDFAKWLGGVSIAIAVQAFGFSILNAVDLVGDWVLCSGRPTQERPRKSILAFSHFLGVLAILFGIIGTVADSTAGFSVVLQATAFSLLGFSFVFWIFAVRKFCKDDW